MVNASATNSQKTGFDEGQVLNDRFLFKCLKEGAFITRRVGEMKNY